MNIEVIIVSAFDNTAHAGYIYDDTTLQLLSLFGTNSNTREIRVGMKDRLSRFESFKLRSTKSILDLSRLNIFLTKDRGGVLDLPFDFECGSA